MKSWPTFSGRHHGACECHCHGKFRLEMNCWGGQLRVVGGLCRNSLRGTGLRRVTCSHVMPALCICCVLGCLCGSTSPPSPAWLWDVLSRLCWFWQNRSMCFVEGDPNGVGSAWVDRRPAGVSGWDLQGTNGILSAQPLPCSYLSLGSLSLSP